MPAQLFDKFWPYPEISSQISLLTPDKEDFDAFLKLIESGETKAIEEWIAETDPDDMVKRLLRLGIPASEGYFTLQFDEILIGKRSFTDVNGTVEYVLSRRVGSKFYHRVYSDDSGDDVHRFETNRPMSKAEFKDLTESPTQWEDDDYDAAGVEIDVSSVWDR